MSNFYRNQLGNDQKRIYTRLVNGENVFITGNAGTGKSFLVEAFNEYCEENDINLLKAAPTGVAACNIKGVTLHKLFNLKTDVKSMLKKETELPEKVAKILNLASVILIDEISMVRLDVFDKIMNYILLANKERNHQRRPDIQIVLVGDFYQLPPVVTDEDKKILDLHYGKNVGNAFAFQSTYWSSLNIQFEKLTEVRRQDGDKPFCTALDKCKEGDSSCMPFFARETSKEEREDAVWLCGRNDTAFEINRRKLDAIDSPQRTFNAEYHGDVSKLDRLCEDEFVCKVGARVLMVVNESSGLYQNGSMGTIVGFDYHEKSDVTVICVAIDSKNDNGDAVEPYVVEVEPQEFGKYEYKTKDRTEEFVDERGEKKRRIITELILTQVGYAKQYPMKLGFAVTVHKAQGQTYEEMNLKPEIFQDGQLYVALSRCRSANTMFIASPLNTSMFRTSQEVVNYYHNPEKYTFFGRGNDLVVVQVKSICENAVKLLDALFLDNREYILDFLAGLELNSTNSRTVTALLQAEREALAESQPTASATVEKSDDDNIQLSLFDVEEEATTEPSLPPTTTENAFSLPQTVEIDRPNEHIALFVQTTGYDKLHDRVIEIDAVKVQGATIVDKFHTLINPQRQITRITTEATGITNSMLENAPNEYDAFCGFLDFVKDTSCVVGHRIQIDLAFIEAIGNRCGIDEPLLFDIIDVYEISKVVYPQLKNRCFDALATALDIDFKRHSSTVVVDMFNRLISEAQKTGTPLKLVS